MPYVGVVKDDTRLLSLSNRERKEPNNTQGKWGKVKLVLNGLTVPLRARLSLGAGCLGG